MKFFFLMPNVALLKFMACILDFQIRIYLHTQNFVSLPYFKAILSIFPCFHAAYLCMFSRPIARFRKVNLLTTKIFCFPLCKGQCSIIPLLIHMWPVFVLFYSFPRYFIKNIFYPLPFLFNLNTHNHNIQLLIPVAITMANAIRFVYQCGQKDLLVQPACVRMAINCTIIPNASSITTINF